MFENIFDFLGMKFRKIKQYFRQISYFNEISNTNFMANIVQMFKK
jgi:hypothetical protein